MSHARQKQPIIDRGAWLDNTKPQTAEIPGGMSRPRSQRGRRAGESKREQKIYSAPMMEPKPTTQ